MIMYILGFIVLCLVTLGLLVIEDRINAFIDRHYHD
jgi:hypothetical protein